MAYKLQKGFLLVYDMLLFCSLFQGGRGQRIVNYSGPKTLHKLKIFKKKCSYCCYVRCTTLKVRVEEMP